MSYYPNTIGHMKGKGWPDSANEYGEATGDFAEIQGRVEGRSVRVLSRTAPGPDNESQSQYAVFTPAEVRVDDVLKIDGVDHIVLDAAPVPDMGGIPWEWEAVC